MNDLVSELITLIRSIYGEGPIPLHRPIFTPNDEKKLAECLRSNFVSTAGNGLIEFESLTASYTQRKYAISTVNGTAALHLALMAVGADASCEVITQPLTFVATANAISYTGAVPVFVDIGRDTLGLCPTKLRNWLHKNCISQNGATINKTTGRKIIAVLPMHTFGIPYQEGEISDVCREFGIFHISDAAEALGTFDKKGKHAGYTADLSVISYNGNKVITTGGGGMVCTDREDFFFKIKKLSTTAKKPHLFEFEHTEVGYNYRMPNINAVLGLSQMTILHQILSSKKQISKMYRDFFQRRGVEFLPVGSTLQNEWLNGFYCHDVAQRDNFLQRLNDSYIQCRAAWKLMPDLEMYKHLETDGLENAIDIQSRIINLPSSAVLNLDQ